MDLPCSRTAVWEGAFSFAGLKAVQLGLVPIISPRTTLTHITMSPGGLPPNISHPGQDPSRYKRYNIPQGDLHFQVSAIVYHGCGDWSLIRAVQAGQTRFRVHSYFFTRESEYWRQLLKPPVSPGDEQKRPGSHERNPFPLSESAEDFADFLWIFYNQ